MAYELEEWVYENQEDVNKVIDHFKKNKRLVVLIDWEKDKSFIIVGDGEDREKDMLQGKAILELVNSHGFPAD